MYGNLGQTSWHCAIFDGKQSMRVRSVATVHELGCKQVKTNRLM